MGDDIYSSLETEVETLKAIYIHELEVTHDDSGRPSCLTVHLYPATADNVTEQFVRLSLILQIPSQYPMEIPKISIRNTRGLSDEEIESIYQATQSIAKEHKGNALLFELIEVAKDHLTGINIPSCECAICLYAFVDNDVLTKTDCFHYFHSHCLAQYVCHTLKQKKGDDEEISDEESESDVMIACPVCRIPISFSLSNKKFPPPAESQDVDVSISTDQRRLQEEMQKLFIKQKEKGGIIDVEAEKNKFLLEISGDPDSSVNAIDTANHQVENCATKVEHKETDSTNCEITSEVDLETLPRNDENNWAASSISCNEGRNRSPKCSFANQSKQHRMFSSVPESHLPSEKVNCTKETSQQIENREQESVLGRDNKMNASSVDDIQQQPAIVPHPHGGRNTEKGKVLYRGPNKRPFRRNHYHRQLQNRVKHSSDKDLQTDDHNCKTETEKSRDAYLNYVSEHAKIDEGKRLISNKDINECSETEIQNKKSEFLDIERRKHDNLKYSGKYNRKFQTTDDKQVFYTGDRKDHKDKEGSFRKKKSRSMMKNGSYSSEEYESEIHGVEQTSRNRLKEITLSNEYGSKNQNVNYQNVKSEVTNAKHDNGTITKSNSTMNDSSRNVLHENETLQNQTKSRQFKTEENMGYYRKGRNGNFNWKYNNNGRRMDYKNGLDNKMPMQNSANEYSKSISGTDSRGSVNSYISKQPGSVQKVSEFADKLNEKEFEGSTRIGEKSNNRGRYNSRRGFYNTPNERQHKCYYKDRRIYYDSLVSEKETFECNASHTVFKNTANEFSSTDSKDTLNNQNMAAESQLREIDTPISQMSKKDEELHIENCKHTNAYNRSNYRGRPNYRGHQRFRYRRNERQQRNSSKDGENYNNKLILERPNFENKYNIKQPATSTKQLQNSSNLISTETGANADERNDAVGKQNHKRNSGAPQPHPKTSTKCKGIYFYPRNRGSYRNHNNNNRISTESRHYVPESHRNSVRSCMTGAEEDTSFKDGAEQQTSHR